MLAIEARHGAKMGPEGGSTQASATEALLLPGPRVEDRRRPCPHMAAKWVQKGPRPSRNQTLAATGPPWGRDQGALLSKA